MSGVNNYPTVIINLDPPKLPLTIGDLMTNPHMHKGECFLLEGAGLTHLVQFVRTATSMYRLICLKNGDRWCDHPTDHDSTPLIPVNVEMTAEAVE